MIAELSTFRFDLFEEIAFVCLRKGVSEGFMFLFYLLKKK